MNKSKTKRGRVVFVTLSFGIIATLMILSANNRAPELTYESPKEESKEVVLDDRAEAYIAEAIEAIDVIIEESEGVSGEPESFNEAFSEARALLGAGHEFTWKGQEYTTSYAEELAANSSPEKEDGLDSDEDSNDTKFTADEDEDVYSAVLGSND